MNKRKSLTYPSAPKMEADDENVLFRCEYKVLVSPTAVTDAMTKSNLGEEVHLT